MNNTWFYTETRFKAEQFKKATGNCYKVVSVNDYADKKGKLGEGLRLRLLILKDSADYGVNKATGKKNDNNVDENFDVTILSRDVVPTKGDYVSLGEFNDENSFVIKFDLILRFNSCQIVKTPATAKKGA